MVHLVRSLARFAPFHLVFTILMHAIQSRRDCVEYANVDDVYELMRAVRSVPCGWSASVEQKKQR